jgi:hypothetical protein
VTGRRIALFVLAGCLAFAGLGFVYLDRIVFAVARPRVPFDAAKAPAPPRYDDPAAWSALPSLDDLADVPVADLPAVAEPEADVFYVHPTSYLGSSWNAPLDDATVNTASDMGGTRIQATAFNGCCAVYAPRYRQANMTVFTEPSADGARALRLAGDDVVAAFRFYLEHYNRGRPFVLAGHSQGSIVATRILEEPAFADAIRERLVAAYLIGSPLSETAPAGLLPICAAPTQTGCVVAFNARSSAYVKGIEPEPVEGRLCVNPLTWRHDEAAAPAASNRGAVFFEASGTPAPRPGFASARCDAGVLRVELTGKPPRDLPSRILDYAIGAGNYHPIEYGLFFADLRENAVERVAAFRSRHEIR